MTEEQEQTAKAIVSVFETGLPRGDYSAVAVLPGDKGGISYGTHQATLASGSLHKLIKAYCSTPGVRYGSALSGYLRLLRARWRGLNDDAPFRRLLRQAATDPLMQLCQDRFFDDRYWAPAQAEAEAAGWETPLGASIVYDGYIHGSWAAMRDRATRRESKANEKDWMRAYVLVRRQWLARRQGPLRATVYRMDAFQRLMGAGNWDLELPFAVRGVYLTAENIGAHRVARQWAVVFHGAIRLDAEERDGRAWVDASVWCAAVGLSGVLGWDQRAGRVTIGGKAVDVQPWIRGSGAWLPVKALAAHSGLRATESMDRKRIDITREGAA